MEQKTITHLTQKQIYNREFSKRPSERLKRREYQLSHPEEFKKYYATYRKKYPDRQLYRTAKTRAANRGLEFNIDYDDIIIPDVCPILGMKMQANVGTGAGGKDNSYSLDRIDQSKGYIKGNVQVISHKANSMKFTASPEELIKFAEWVLRTYK